MEVCLLVPSLFLACADIIVASSDATNLKNTTARVEGDKVIVNGHKWWISGAGDPRNAIHIVLAVTDPSNPSPHKRHSLVLVQPSSKGVDVVRPLQVFGYDDAPEGHCEVKYKDVVIGVEEGIVGGRAGLGRGFEVSLGHTSCSLGRS